MAAPGQQRRLPLEAWVYATAIVLAALLLVVPLVMGTDLPKANEFTRYNGDRLSLAKQEEPDYLIVLLGDSKLKYATDIEVFDSDERLAVVRIVQNRATFGDFEQLARPILAADPDLIVLQESLLTHKRLSTIDFRELQQLVLWGLFAPESDFHPGRIDQTALQTSRPCTNDFGNESLERRLTRQASESRHGIDHDEARSAAAFLRAAEVRGLDTVVLRLPNHPRFDAHVAAGEKGIAPFTARTPATTVWAPSAAIDIRAEDFCDFVHLNPGGRAKVSSWLQAEIRSRLHDADTG